MPNTAPRHVSDMEKSVESAKINERTKISNILDLSLSDLTNEEFLDQCLSLLLALTLKYDSS